MESTGGERWLAAGAERIRLLERVGKVLGAVATEQRRTAKRAKAAAGKGGKGKERKKERKKK